VHLEKVFEFHDAIISEGHNGVFRQYHRPR
jgi:hypothetical protein